MIIPDRQGGIPLKEGRSREQPRARRLCALQERLQQAGLHAALLSHPRDVYYYAGTGQPCNLWVPAEGPPVLFARRVEELVRASTWVERVLSAGSYGQMQRHLEALGLLPPWGAAVGLEMDVLPAALAEGFRRAFPGIHLANISALVLQQRAVKDPGEVAAIRQAAELWEHAHAAVLAALRPGVPEFAVAAALEAAVRKAGGEGAIWFRRWDACLPGGGLVASGANLWTISGHAMTVTGTGMGPSLPWGASRRLLEPGDLVVVDYGVCRDAYHADMARTYCVGRPGPAQRDLWNRLLDLHLQVIEGVRPGVTGAELYARAQALAAEAGHGDHFMGYGANQGRYIGHAIGLEMDEFPVLAPGEEWPLPPGAVVTLEPKLIVPGVGAVMVEDDILVTETGCEVLGRVGRELFSV